MKLLIVIIIVISLGLILLVFLKKPATLELSKPQQPVSTLALQPSQSPIRPVNEDPPSNLRALADNSALQELPTPLAQVKLIEMAEKVAKKAINIPSSVTPNIQYSGKTAVITWKITRPSLPNEVTFGADYYAQVKINIYTGEVIEILGGS